MLMHSCIMFMQEVEQAIGQAMMEAGLGPDAGHLDYAAFMRLLSSDLADSSRSINKFASMKAGGVLHGADTTSLSDLLKQACSSTIIGRRRTGCTGALDDGAGGSVGEAALSDMVAAELAGAAAAGGGGSIALSDAYARAMAGRSGGGGGRAAGAAVGADACGPSEMVRNAMRPVAEDGAAAAAAAPASSAQAAQTCEPEVEMGRGGPPGGGGRGVRGGFEGWDDGDARPKAAAPERLVRPGDKGPKLRARMSSDDRVLKPPPQNLESLLLQPQ